MKRIKVIDLYSVKYDAMTEKINDELKDIENGGNEILDVKIIGEKLNQCAVFVYYRVK